MDIKERLRIIRLAEAEAALVYKDYPLTVAQENYNAAYHAALIRNGYPHKNGVINA